MPPSSDILAKLFGSVGRLKIIRLFLLNPEETFRLGEISRRAKVPKSVSRREVLLLKKAGLLKSHSISINRKLRDRSKSVLAKISKERGRIKRRKIQGWKLNESFSLLSSLKNFILDTVPIDREKLLKKLQKIGRLKLVILAGIFGNEDSSRVDIFMVGDKIRRAALEKAIRDIEAEVGKELTYAAFTAQEFLYRFGMYDKFIRDILDYPHEKILDKINIGI